MKNQFKTKKTYVSFGIKNVFKSIKKMSTENL